MIALLRTAALGAGLASAAIIPQSAASTAADCAAPWAVELGPGFQIICASPQLRALSDEAVALLLRLPGSGSDWRATPDLTPGRLVELCGGRLPATPEVVGCYADWMEKHIALLRGRLNAIDA